MKRMPDAAANGERRAHLKRRYSHMECRGGATQARPDGVFRWQRIKNSTFENDQIRDAGHRDSCMKPNSVETSCKMRGRRSDVGKAVAWAGFETTIAEEDGREAPCGCVGGGCGRSAEEGVYGRWPKLIRRDTGGRDSR